MFLDGFSGGLLGNVQLHHHKYEAAPEMNPLDVCFREKLEPEDQSDQTAHL